MKTGLITSDTYQNHDTGPGHPEQIARVTVINENLKKITKIKPKLSTTGGTSDLRFIRKISPGLEFGLVGRTMHKLDEAVSLKDLKNLTKIYQNILQNYFK